MSYQVIFPSWVWYTTFFGLGTLAVLTGIGEFLLSIVVTQTLNSHSFGTFFTGVMFLCLGAFFFYRGDAG